MDVERVLAAKRRFDDLGAERKRLRGLLAENGIQRMLANFDLQHAVYGKLGPDDTPEETAAAQQRHYNETPKPGQ